MMWLQILCLFTLVLTLLLLGINREWSNGFPEFLAFMGIVFYLLALVTYEEPQSIKEKAVQLGVGKFIADEKGKVDFYFIVNGKEVKYEGRYSSDK